MPSDPLVLDLPSNLQSIHEIVDTVVRHCAGPETIDRRLNLNLRVGLTEALANAVLYGNGEDPEKNIRLEVDLGEREISIRVTDQGLGFDPEAIPDPTAPENLERATGRGVFLMRKLMDEVHFNETGNSVTLILRVEGDELAPGSTEGLSS